VYTASDTKQSYVGVSGAWSNLGPRRGRVTMAGGETTLTVTLSPAEPNTNYSVMFSNNWQSGHIRWTAKNTGDFRLAWAGTAAAAGEILDWILVQDT
jgi:hypothetical protein